MSRRWRVQLTAVVRKEVLQTVRDKRIVFMLVAAPLIQTLLFGAAVDLDVDDVPTVVVDGDRTTASRELVRRVLADGTLSRAGTAPSAADAERMLDEGRAAAAIVVPPRLSADLEAGRAARVQILVDGTDPNRSSVAAAAASRFFGEEAQRMSRERAARSGAVPPRIEVVPRVLYNASLETSPYLVPGIMAMLLVVVTTIVTAMGLAREREVGTLEQVLVTPIERRWLLVGKMVPFLVIGAFDVLLVLSVGSWVFAVPLHGSFVALAAGTVVYLLCTLAVGLLISTMSTTQQQSFLGGFLFALPAILLSGIMTPIHSMPRWLQLVTYANPLRYYAELVRSVLLKGAGVVDVAFQLGALAVFAAAIVTAAALRFGKTLG
ncbi:MAG TPA: ABC transporter permease [Anaeromyxobacteraceae bacterium]|nr:ABC transporter permease [Anaeromyxobacteraceae bacterium]